MCYRIDKITEIHRYQHIWRRIVFACVLRVWSSDSTLLVESGDCYLLLFCRSGALARPCKYSPAVVICLDFGGLNQLFNRVSGVLRLLLACILQGWSNYESLSAESADC